MKKKSPYVRTNIAMYGIFGATSNGADFLVAARDKNGKPLMTYAEAQERLNDFDGRATMQIRKI